MRILLLGKDGQLGWELQRALAPLGELHACGRQQADLSDLDGLRRLLEQLRPDAIVNAAADTEVDQAESVPERVFRINAEAVAVLAEQARRTQAWLIQYSTDYVFDGEQATPYVENDATHPLSAYGRSKLAGEEAIRTTHQRHIIFRTSWLYGAHGSNFAKTILRLAQQQDTLRVVADQIGTPSAVEMVADITALALYRVSRMPDGDALAGTYHLAAAGTTSWHGYAQELLGAARSAGWALRAGPEQVQAITSADYPTAARRPKNSRLDTRKLCNAFGLHLPPWQFHLQRLVEQLGRKGIT